MHATMFNTFSPNVLNSLQNKKMKMCTCTVHQIQILVCIPEYWAQYTSQFKMQVYAIHCTVDNALFQLRYLFDFTLFVCSHQWDSFGECLNRM